MNGVRVDARGLPSSGTLRPAGDLCCPELLSVRVGFAVKAHEKFGSKFRSLVER